MAQQTMKPVARLSHTEWLTDARDAQCGDAVVRINPETDAVEEYTITDVLHTDGQMGLVVESDVTDAFTAEGINRTRHAVVDYRQNAE